MMCGFALPLAVSLSTLVLLLLSWVQQLTPITMLHDVLFPPPFALADPSRPSYAFATLFLPNASLPFPSSPARPHYALPTEFIPCIDNISCSLGNLTLFSPPESLCASHPPPPLPPPAHTPVAVLIEGRDTYWDRDTLAFLVNDALHHLPDRWMVYLMVQPAVAEWLLSKPTLVSAMCARRLNVQAMPTSLSFTDRGLYNRLLSHYYFWRLWHGHSHVHVFEVDTGYCEQPTRSWDFFLQFDFCGARWGNWGDTCFEAVNNYTKNCVGNSGFSLWRQPVMEYLTQPALNITFPSAGALIDSFWTLQMRLHWPDYKPCPYDEADRFSSETFFVPNHPEDIPLGWHKPYLHRRTEQALQRFKTVCPHWHNLTSHEGITNLL